MSYSTLWTTSRRHVHTDRQTYVHVRAPRILADPTLLHPPLHACIPDASVYVSACLYVPGRPPQSSDRERNGDTEEALDSLGRPKRERERQKQLECKDKHPDWRKERRRREREKPVYAVRVCGQYLVSRGRRSGEEFSFLGVLGWKFGKRRSPWHRSRPSAAPRLSPWSSEPLQPKR